MEGPEGTELFLGEDENEPEVKDSEEFAEEDFPEDKTGEKLEDADDTPFESGEEGRVIYNEKKGCYEIGLGDGYYARAFKQSGRAFVYDGQAEKELVTVFPLDDQYVPDKDVDLGEENTRKGLHTALQAWKARGSEKGGIFSDRAWLLEGGRVAYCPEGVIDRLFVVFPDGIEITVFASEVVDSEYFPNDLRRVEGLKGKLANISSRVNRR